MFRSYIRWHETNALLGIPPEKKKKIGFIFREFQFEVCNHSKPNVTSSMANEREPFYKEEKEDGGAIETTKST